MIENGAVLAEKGGTECACLVRTVYCAYFQVCSLLATLLVQLGIMIECF